MSTAIPKDALSALVASMTSHPIAFILWEGAKKGPVVASSDAKRMILNVVARRALGDDEEKREYVPDPDNLPDGLLVRTTFKGQRAITISVRAENMGEEEGFDLLERLRTVIQSNENRAALNALELSLASTGQVRNVTGTAGNRAISVATLDVILNQGVDIVVTKAGDTYIETVEGEAELEAAS